MYTWNWFHRQTRNRIQVCNSSQVSVSRKTRKGADYLRAFVLVLKLVYVVVSLGMDEIVSVILPGHPDLM